jgi:uncharacterized protein (TIGR03000 family)
MSGSRFFAPAAALSAALLVWSAGLALAAGHAAPAHSSFHGPSSGFHGSMNSFHGGFNSFHGNVNQFHGNFNQFHGGFNDFHHGFNSFRVGVGVAFYGGGLGGYYPGYFGSYGSYYAPSYSTASYYSPSVYTSPASYYGGPSLADYSGGYAGDTSPAQQPPGPPPPPDGTAAVGVHVPPDAEILFNGNPTKQKGEFREFVTPTLTPGQTFQYDIRARWKENGQDVDETRTVTVQANKRSVVDFAQPEQEKVGPPK